ETVPDVADAVLARDLGREMLLPELLGEPAGNLIYRHPLPTADVENLSGGLGYLERQPAAFGDIANVDEIPPLLAILEDKRPIAVEQACGKYGKDPGIGIGEGLPRAIHVEEAQRRRRDVVSTADHEAEAFLVVLGQRVDRGERGWLRLGRRHRRERCAIRTCRFPFSASQLRAAALPRDGRAGCITV